MKLAFISLALFGAILPSHAASLTWDSDPSTPGIQDGAGIWNLANTNWWDGAANTNWTSANPDSATLGAGGTAGIVSLGGPITAAGITFAGVSGGSYLIQSNTLTLSGSPTLVANVDATIASVLAGAGFMKFGPGTLTLRGTNTYTGATVLIEGQLTIQQGTTFASTNVSIPTGAVLEYNTIGGAVSQTPVVISQAKTVAHFGAGVVRITGTNYIAFSGSATGAVNFNMATGGWFDVRSSDVQFGWTHAAFGANYGSLNVAAGAGYHNSDAAWQFDSLTGAGTVGNAYNAAVTLTVGVSGTRNDPAYGVADNTATFSGSIKDHEFYNNLTTANLNLTKVGSGTQVLAGVNTYQGSTTVSGGTLLIPAGGSIGSASIISVGGASTGTLTISGGNVTSSVASGNALAVGVPGSSPGVLNMLGGTLVLSGLNGAFQVGDNSVAVYNQSGGSVTVASSAENYHGNNAGGISTLRFSGGSFSQVNAGFRLGVRAATTVIITNSASVTLAGLIYGHPSTGGGNDNVNLDGGTLALTGFTKQSGTANLSFNGGVLRARTNSATFLTGLDAATVKAGGAWIDTTNFTITIGQALVTGGAGNDGGLTKLGPGTLILAGANTYTGATAVSSGSLLVNGTLAGGAVSVAAGTTLGGAGTIRGAVANAGTLSPGNSAGLLTVSNNVSLGAGGTVLIELAGATVGSGYDQLNVSGALAMGGTLNVVTTNGFAPNGLSFTILKYGSKTGGFAVTNLPALAAGFTWDVQNTATSLVITALNLGSTNLVWSPSTSADWDVSTTNWFSPGAAAASLYEQGDNVRFDDTGAISNVVTLTAVMTPEQVTVNSASNYTFAGPGSLGGSMSLTKDGAGTLAITATNNAYVGGTTISNGTIQLGTGGAAGTLGSGPVANSGTLAFNNSDTNTTANVIAGPGNLTKAGPGSVNLTAANSFTGSTAISGGTLQVSAPGSLGGGAYAAGIANQGALTFNAATQTLSGVVSGTGSLSQVGGGLVTLSGVAANTYSGLTTLVAGQMALSKPAGVAAVPGNFTGNNVASPDVYATADNQFGPGAVMSFVGTGGDHVRFELLGTTQTLAGIDNTAASGFGVIQTKEQVGAALVRSLSTLVLNGAGAYSYNGYLRDNGGTLQLIKDGIGTQTLAGANVSYTAGTTISNGVLALASGAGGANGAIRGVVTIMPGGTLRSLFDSSFGYNAGASVSTLNIIGGTVDNGTNYNHYWNSFKLNMVGGTLYMGGAANQNQMHDVTVIASNSAATSQILPSSAAPAWRLRDSTHTRFVVEDGPQAVDLLMAVSIVHQNSGSGISKTGPGTMVLSTNNTYDGPTTISNGVLALTGGGAISNSATVTVLPGATFDASSVGGFLLGTNKTLQGGGLVTGPVVSAVGSRILPGLAGGVGTLTFGNSLSLNAGTTNLFDLNTDNTPGAGINDLVSVGGLLEPSGAVVQVNGITPLTNGTYRLFTYTGVKTTTFNTNVVGNTSRKSYTLDEATGGQVNLQVTGTYAVLSWRPQANASWDLASSNWFDTVNSITDRFANLDAVTFDDAGAYSNVVTITNTVQPGSMLVNSSSNYTLSGAGKIAGAFDLAKHGAGTLTLATTGGNTFTGAVLVGAGRLQRGQTSANAFGLPSSITVSNGAQVLMNGGNADTGARGLWYRVAGTGPDGLGAIYNNGAFLGSYAEILNVTLLGDTTLGTASQRMSIATGFSSGTGWLDANGYTLSINNGTNGLIDLRGPATNLLGVIVSNGAFGVESSSNNLGALVRVSAGAELNGANASETAKVVLVGATLAGRVGASTWNGPVELQGDSTFNTTARDGGAADFTVNGAISGPYSLAKRGGGNVTLGGSEPITYTGTTTVYQGALYLSKTVAPVILGDLVFDNNLSPDVYTFTNNMLSPASIVRFVTDSGDHGRFELMGTTQTVAGIETVGYASQRGVIQNREMGPANTATSTLVLVGSGSYSFGGYLRDSSGKLSVIKNGTGTQTLYNGQINFTGGMTINSGEVVLASANVGSGAWTINSGTVVRATATDAIDNQRVITINEGGQLIHAVSGGYNQFYNANQGGTILVLNGGTVTSSTAVAHGTYGNYLLRGNVSVGGTTTSVISADFRMGDNADRTITVADTPAEDDLLFQGKVSHFEGNTWGYMTKQGPGTMTFTHLTNSVGRVTVSAGRVLFRDTVGQWANGGIINNALAEMQVSAGSNVYYGGGTSGTGVLYKSGSGVLTLAGTLIDQTGPTIIGAGTVIMTNVDDSLVTGNAITISNGATLVIDTSARTFAFARTTTIAGSGALVKAGAANVLAVGANNQGVTMAMGAGGLIDVRVGTMRNEYGAFNNWTNNRSSLSISNGAAFYVWDANTTVDALTGAGSIDKGQNNTHTLTVGAAGGSGVFGGTISNTVGVLHLMKAGSGTQVLNGNNTYSGTTTVSNGVLALGASGQLLGPTQIAVVSGAVFDVTSVAGYTLLSNQTLAGRGNVAGAVTVANGGLVQPGFGSGSGTGQLTLATLAMGTSAASTSRLAVTLGQRSDILNVTNGLTLNGTVQLSALASSSLATQTYDLIRYAGGLSGGLANLAFVPPPEVLRWAPLSDNGSVIQLTVLLANTLYWDGTPTNVWDVGVNTNWVDLPGGTHTDFRTNETVTFDDTASNFTVVVNTAVPPYTAIVKAETNNYVFTGAGAISGSAFLQKSGAGTLTMTLTNTYTGSTAINGGTLALTGNAVLGAGTYGGAITNNGTLLLGSAAVQTFNGVISGTGTIAKTGGNYLYLGANNTFTGPFNILGGVVRQNVNTAFSTGVVMTVSNAVMETQYTGYSINWVNVGSLTLAGGATLRAAPQTFPDNGDIGFQDNILVIRTNTISATGGSYGKHNWLAGGMTGDTNAYINLSNGSGYGVYADRRAIILNSSYGVWSNYLGTLNAANDVTIQGHLDLLNANVVVNGTFGFYPGGSYGLGIAHNLVVQFGSLSGAGNLVAGAATNGEWRVGNLNTTSTYSGVIDGASKLTKIGTGKLILGGASTLSGLTTVNAGILQVGAASSGALGSGPITVNAGAILQFGRTDAGLVVSNVIGGAGTVVQNGSGITTLAAANTGSGPTIISNGTLRVNGSLSDLSAVRVDPAGTLGGAGAASGTVSLAGTVSPGASVGTLTTGSETWEGGAAIRMEITDVLGTYGAHPGWDKLQVNGGLTINATAASQMTVRVVTLNTLGGSAIPANLSANTSYVLPFATVTGAISGFATNAFALDLSGFASPYALTNVQVALVGTNLALVLETGSALNALVWDADAAQGLPQDGSGTWDLANTNWLNGSTNVSWIQTAAGQLGADTNSGGSYTVTVAAATIQATSLTFPTGSTYTVAGTNTLSLQGGSIAVSNDAATISAILGGGGFTKTGPGTLTLTRAGTANTYAGSIVVSEGTLAAAGTVGDGTIRGDVSVAAGATYRQGGDNIVINTALFTLPAGATMDLNGRTEVLGRLVGSGSVINNNSASGLSLDLGTGASSTFDGTISGTGYLALRGGNAGAGTQVLGGAVNASALYVGNISSADTTYLTITGGVTTLSGILYIAQPAGSRGTLTLSGGTLTANGASATLGDSGIAALIQSGGAITVKDIYAANNGGSSAITVSGGSFSAGECYLGVRAGATLNVQGAGIVTLSTLRYAHPSTGGGTSVVNLDGGELRVQGVVRHNGTANFNFNGGRLVARTNNAAFMTGLTAATVLNGGAVIDSAGFDITVGQGLLNGGAGGLTKLGAGTLRLTGTNNTFAGVTTVSNGALLLDSSIAGSAAVAVGATLGGTGRVTGFVSNDGFVAPGDFGVGRLSCGSFFIQGAAGTLQIEITGNTSGTYDQVAASGGAFLDGQLAVTNVSYTPVFGDSFTVLTAVAISGSFASTNLPAIAATNAWLVSYSNNQVVLSVVAQTFTGYDLWVSQITNAADRGYNSDPDGDGSPNLWEYSQGTDPTNGLDTAKLIFFRTNGIHYVKFNRATSAVDLVYNVDTSYALTNNATWRSIATYQTGSGWSGDITPVETNSGPVVQVTAEDDDPLATFRGMRVRITRP